MATLPDYSINVAQPFMEALKGYQLGMGFEAAKQQNILQQQQAQQALQQQQALQDAQRLVFQKPSAENYARLMTLDPKSSEAYQRAWSARNAEQQETLAADLLKQGAAITSGKPEIAAQYLEDKASAIEAQNNGQPTPESQAVRTQARLMKEHPQFALGQIQALLAVNPLGKSASEALAKFGEESRAQALQPSALTEAKAKADKAAVAAKFAESDAVLDLQKKGWDITKIQEDIKIAKQNAGIAALNAQIAREGNALKREENQLKLQDMLQKRDAAVREKAADVESARFNIDNMLNTADRILKNPKLNDVVGTIEGRLPVVLSDEAQDAVALIETLGSQAFLSQIPNVKGMGALSNAEGEKLQNAFQNLGRVQSEKQFRQNLKEAQRLLLKARQNVSRRYGVPESVPDTPAVQTAPADIDALVKKYGGG